MPYILNKFGKNTKSYICDGCGDEFNGLCGLHIGNATYCTSDACVEIGKSTPAFRKKTQFSKRYEDGKLLNDKKAWI